MKLPKHPVSQTAHERGVALLISIFALLLISGVAISLIVMSGTEAAIAGNAKGNTQVFYASYAGLEEARGRMWPIHPNTLDATTGVNKGAGTMPLNKVVYILNPSPGEVVNPIDLSSTNAYRDTEYLQEFGVPANSGTLNVTTVVSTAPVAGLPGLLFKWVRITAKSERSAGVDTNGDGVLDSTTPLSYDGKHQNLAGSGRQVLRATALAVFPNGSRRILQYDIAPVVFNVAFPAALTFDGFGDALFPANSNVYWVNGNDNSGISSCGGGVNQPARPAIGVPDNVDDTIITGEIPPNRKNHYIGLGPAPDVENVTSSMSANMQTVAGLEGLMSTIKDNATYVFNGNQSSLPAAALGTASAPTITYVDGDLSVGPGTGYGILVVRGTFNASGNTGWRGIVLVVGKGDMTVSGGGNNEFDGAVFLANTLDDQGRQLPSLGDTILNWAGGGGNGIYYSSGCVNWALNSTNYRVLSFREIAE
jgi:hypothetical protein